jgi:prepilin-type N-terminal cleavage/methylation domain-containing protein
MPSAAGGPPSRGFTLVEVVVVAVIVSVLAGVAIGVYIAYVDAGQETSANNLAASLATFCASCRTTGGMPDDSGELQSGSLITCASGSMGDLGWEVPPGYIVRIDFPGSGGGIGVVIATSERGTVSHTYNW